MSAKSIPTLYEWAGGMAALERLTNHFYEQGSRLAVINSKTAEAVESSAPMPRWGWGEVGGPYQP